MYVCCLSWRDACDCSAAAFLTTTGCCRGKMVYGIAQWTERCAILVRTCRLSHPRITSVVCGRLRRHRRLALHKVAFINIELHRGCMEEE